MGLAPSLRALAGYFLAGFKPFFTEKGHSPAVLSLVLTSFSFSLE